MIIKSPLPKNFDLRLITALLLVVSFSLGEVYRYLLVMLAIFGIFLVIRRYDSIKNVPGIRFLLLLFLCIWVPMLVALIDAEYLERSASVTGRFVIFPLAGIALLYSILRQDLTQKLLWGTCGIVILWTIDGLIQFIWGHDILGNPAYSDGRLTGTFSNWPHVGVILAIFLPVYLEGLYQMSMKSRWSWLLILPVLFVILLGGGRSSWVLTAIALIIYFIYFKKLGRQFSWRRSFLLAATSLVLFTVTTLNVDWLSQRVNTSLGIFSGDYKSFRLATSLRPPIWTTALNMSTHHWINGVGPRAFQSSYRKYSTMPDDPFLTNSAGHPHLYILEVAAETGLIGIAGYIIFFILVIRHMSTVMRSRYSNVIPWGIAGLVAAFPLSSTMSFYAYFSSCLMWTLFIIYIAFSMPVNRVRGSATKDEIEVAKSAENHQHSKATREIPV
jgi:O-antigen ligase